MIRQAFHCKHVKDLCSQVILLFLVPSNLFFIEDECLDFVLTIPYGSLEDSSKFQKVKAHSRCKSLLQLRCNTSSKLR